MIHTSGYAQAGNGPFPGQSIYGSITGSLNPQCDRPLTPLNEAQNTADRIEKMLHSLLSQLHGSVDSLIGSMPEAVAGNGQAPPMPGGRVHALVSSLTNCERLADQLQSVAHRLSSV